LAETAALSSSAMSSPQAYTSTAGPAGGHRLDSGSRGLASFGFAVRPGPALPPVEDPPPAPSSPGTGPRSLRLSRSSKREREMQKIKKQKKRKGRMRPPGEKLKDKVRKRRPENREADKRRHETAEAKRLQRERQKTDEYRAGDATRQARRRVAARKKAARVHTEKFHANRTSETVYEGGTWQQASQAIAEIEGRAREELPSIMPPSFVGLHEPTSLQHISELYGFFKQTKWCACVGCWRAWYSTPRGYAFDQVTTKMGARRPWFQPEQSTFFPEHDRPSAFGQTLCYFSSIHLKTRLDVIF